MRAALDFEAAGHVVAKNTICLRYGKDAEAAAGFRAESFAMLAIHSSTKAPSSGAVTNGEAQLQRAKIARFGLARRFDHVQIEGEHGLCKPEERGYQRAMQSLGVGPAETWMVGYNLEWEVIAPQRLGIYAVWHDHRRGLPQGTTARLRRWTGILAGVQKETPKQNLDIQKSASAQRKGRLTPPECFVPDREGGFEGHRKR